MNWQCILSADKLTSFIFFMFIFLSLYFLEQFQDHSKIKGKVAENSCILHACTHIQASIINISHQSGTCVTTDEPTLTHQNHTKSIVYIMVYFWGILYVFGKMYNDR